MTKYVMIILSLLMSGCVSVETLPEEASLSAGKSPWSKIYAVRMGMTYEEVAAAMGEKVTIGYDLEGALSGTYKPITLANPYRKEFFKGGKSRVYDVVYYFTQIRTADGVISDDELTPLIFENGVLVGKGWEYLSKLKGSSRV